MYMLSKAVLGMGKLMAGLLVYYMFNITKHPQADRHISSCLPCIARTHVE